MNHKNYLFFLVFIPWFAVACQSRSISFLQRLPKDLWQELLQFIMENDPLWQDNKDYKNKNIYRIGMAIALNAVANELCDYALNPLIINRMRSDLMAAKYKILEPFYTNNTKAIFEAFCQGKLPPCEPTRLSPFSDQNPKMYQRILPIQSILIYDEFDRAWRKDFDQQRMRGDFTQTYFSCCPQTSASAAGQLFMEYGLPKKNNEFANEKLCVY